MIFLYLGAYLFILALIWGLFIVAKLHAYKFKHFSHNIVPVTTVLCIFLIIISIIGFILIFMLDSPRTTIKLDNIDISEENYY